MKSLTKTVNNNSTGHWLGVRWRRRIVWVLFWALVMGGYYPLAGQAGRGLGVWMGRVLTLTGDPAQGARVKAEYYGPVNDLSLAKRNKPLAVRETVSDAAGKWVIMGTAGGVWRVWAELNGQTSSEVVRYQAPGKQTDLGGGLDLARIDLILRPQRLEVFLDARRAVYETNWEKVLTLLDAAEKEPAVAAVMDELLYWRAYSCFKLGQKKKDFNLAKTYYMRGLEALEKLENNYPNGLWADDGRMLILELWHWMVKGGEKSYLENIVKYEQSENMDVKLAALDVHFCLEPSAPPAPLKSLALEHPDPAIRKKALLIVSRFDNPDSKDILLRAWKTDKDLSVRNRAQLLLEK